MVVVHADYVPDRPHRLSRKCWCRPRVALVAHWDRWRRP